MERSCRGCKYNEFGGYFINRTELVRSMYPGIPETPISSMSVLCISCYSWPNQAGERKKYTPQALCTGMEIVSIWD